MVGTASQTQNDTIDKMSTQYETQMKAFGELNSKFQEENEMTRYLDIFRRHDLSKLAQIGLIEPRVNNATKSI